ncbi:MAG: protein translocase subunit SecF [Acidimicrobiales bacterium]|jgi:preprotein translocase subunit SecF
MSTASIALGSAEERRPNALVRLYRGQTRFDFVRRRKWWFAASGLVIIAGLVSLGVKGLNYSIEFVGGTSWEVAAPGVTVAQAQSALAPLGFGGATITQLASGSKESLNVETKLASGKPGVSTAEATRVAAVLAALAHKPASSVSVENVGPTWGSDITHKAVEALIVFLIVIAAYISLFFEWKMALSAIVAVAHDILVTVGIYSLASFLVTPDTVVAFLTVLGYSLYDTIVVFDRVRDNSRGLGATGKLSYSDVVNLSMNQTLARSINTSLVAILPILSVLVLGAEVLGAVTLEYFGLALLIGLTSGAYSSIFIASPLLAVSKEHEDRYRKIRERLESRGTATQLISPAALAAGALSGPEPATSVKRRRAGGVAPARPSTLRPGSARGAAVAVADEEAGEGGPEAGFGDDGAAATGNGDGKLPGPRGTPKRPAPAPRAGTPTHRPPPRPRKKGRRR